MDGFWITILFSKLSEKWINCHKSAVNSNCELTFEFPRAAVCLLRLSVISASVFLSGTKVSQNSNKGGKVHCVPAAEGNKSLTVSVFLFKWLYIYCCCKVQIIINSKHSKNDGFIILYSCLNQLNKLWTFVFATSQIRFDQVNTRFSLNSSWTESQSKWQLLHLLREVPEMFMFNCIKLRCCPALTDQHDAVPWREKRTDDSVSNGVRGQLLNGFKILWPETQIERNRKLVPVCSKNVHL